MKARKKVKAGGSVFLRAAIAIDNGTQTFACTAIDRAHRIRLPFSQKREWFTKYMGPHGENSHGAWMACGGEDDIEAKLRVIALLFAKAMWEDGVE